MKFILTIALGIAIGYAVGFGDAKENEKNVAVRVIERIGGSNRDRVATDVDARMEAVERQ